MKLRKRYAVPALIAAVISTGGAAFHVAREVRRVDAEIVAAAEAFIATLDAAGRAKAVRPLEDQERFNWNFVPIARNGLPLKEMTLEQRSAAHVLLQTALSSQGMLKATGVMRLEEILGLIENRPAMRDPENYFFWIFGTPSLTTPWAWRFEGHHMSMSFTSARGVTVAAPVFFGSNPARVPSGPHAGWRLLGAEEDLGRALVRSLDAEQRTTAIISATAPNDILTLRNRPAVIDPVAGLPVAAMNGVQRQIFMRLLSEYLDNADPAIAAARLTRLQAVGIEKLHFAWAGTMDVGGPHYYRIQGPTVIIEYDNTQNNANHIHSVFRDLENDFGEDLLGTHYETASAGHGHDVGLSASAGARR
jgi:hypothetical protein